MDEEAGLLGCVLVSSRKGRRAANTMAKTRFISSERAAKTLPYNCHEAIKAEAFVVCVSS
jgi:hypothetical protein